ncbi:alkaline phosphatase D family protein [Streptomyces thermolineatus]|uniref:alkaline phosphatase D family protein n=1 Tax=Streptomyces thermolineatus TaxID=44033 RepID=UPI00384D3FAC
MAGLRLGPLLRHVGTTTATVWVETDRPCEVEVVCGAPLDGGGTGDDSSGNSGGSSGSGNAASASCRTWRVAGHHYALVVVPGLPPGSVLPYRVLLDGAPVWPPADAGHPPSTVRTLPDDSGAVRGDATVRVAFGSCRWTTPGAADSPSVGPDALDTLAAHLARSPRREWPDVLLLLGDQVYADEVSPGTRRYLAGRRTGSPGEAPADQVADYEEYTHLYHESWLDPGIRRLLSTVPSCMIFDDHDVIDDWNTSEAWLAGMRGTPWWRERILGGFASYWVHQHLGNLSPAELETDKLYAEVRAAGAGDGDAYPLLREFAARAEADPGAMRWSYRRDFGRVRLVMVDSRAGRILEEDGRRILGEDGMEWLREQCTPDGSFDHLLIGTSLPWLLPHAVHDAETWNAALCAGRRGPRWARLSERIRRAGDLEHWAAFPESFEALAGVVARAGRGPEAPASVCVLSGDVHHAYVADARWRKGERPGSAVFQLTCSPVHNSVPAAIRLGFRLGWSRPARWAGRALRRHGHGAAPSVAWRRSAGPFFGNQLMTLTLTGRAAGLRLQQARPAPGGPRLVTVLDRALTPGVGGAAGPGGAAGTPRTG